MTLGRTGSICIECCYLGWEQRPWCFCSWRISTHSLTGWSKISLFLWTESKKRSCWNTEESCLSPAIFQPYQSLASVHRESQRTLWTKQKVDPLVGGWRGTTQSARLGMSNAKYCPWVWAFTLSITLVKVILMWHFTCILRGGGYWPIQLHKLSPWSNKAWQGTHWGCKPWSWTSLKKLQHAYCILNPVCAAGAEHCTVWHASHSYMAAA